MIQEAFLDYDAFWEDALSCLLGLYLVLGGLHFSLSRNEREESFNKKLRASFRICAPLFVLAVFSLPILQPILQHFIPLPWLRAFRLGCVGSMIALLVFIIIANLKYLATSTPINSDADLGEQSTLLPS